MKRAQKPGARTTDWVPVLLMVVWAARALIVAPPAHADSLSAFQPRQTPTTGSTASSRLKDLREPRALQQPTFRSAVDLIAVDVQVIDREGRPVTTLQPPDFQVSINGRTRRVASADLVQYSAASGGSISTTPGASDPSPNPAQQGRVFVLAVDASSFTVQAWNRLKDATRGFVNRLQANDRLALYGYPGGPRIDPTTDHSAISRGLASIAGQRHRIQSQFNLTASEAIDVVAEVTTMRNSPADRASLQNAFGAGTDTPAVLNIQSRECPAAVTCPARILMDATSIVNELEGQVAQSVSGLRALLRLLSTYPGRKTVVLLSAGMTVSDRPGGRPEIDNMARVLGLELAQANAAIYTMHMDAGFLDTYSAEMRSVASAGDTEQRDRAMLGKWLEQFSAASGGRLLSVPAGRGEAEFDRVLQETSAYYLLGVEPAAADRDGRLRELKVKVGRRGLTIRSRTWVVIPARSGDPQRHAEYLPTAEDGVRAAARREDVGKW